MKKNNVEAKAGEPVRVWGLAAGRGSTRAAAPGALCWREYAFPAHIPRADWRVIIAVRPIASPRGGLEEHP